MRAARWTIVRCRFICTRLAFAMTSAGAENMSRAGTNTTKPSSRSCASARAAVLFRPMSCCWESGLGGHRSRDSDALQDPQGIFRAGGAEVCAVTRAHGLSMRWAKPWNALTARGVNTAGATNPAQLRCEEACPLSLRSSSVRQC
jgi:hypothetical protein